MNHPHHTWIHGCCKGSPNGRFMALGFPHYNTLHTLIRMFLYDTICIPFGNQRWQWTIPELNGGLLQGKNIYKCVVFPLQCVITGG